MACEQCGTPLWLPYSRQKAFTTMRDREHLWCKMGVPLSQSTGEVPCQKTQRSWFMATFIGINDDSFLELGFPWFSHNFEVRNPDFLWICGLSWSHWRRKQQLRRPRRRQRVWPRCAGVWRTWGRMWRSLSYVYIYIYYMYYSYIILYITLCI